MYDTPYDRPQDSNPRTNEKKEECYLMPQLPVTKTRFLEQREQDKGKNNNKNDDYRHGANRSGRLEQSKREQAYDGERKKDQDQE
jgi:hypothetical protein